MIRKVLRWPPTSFLGSVTGSYRYTTLMDPTLPPPGRGRQLAMALMNLMPGSMVQQVVDASGRPADAPDADPTAVELHTLSGELAPAAQWEELQCRVARAVGVQLQPRTQSR